MSLQFDTARFSDIRLVGRVWSVVVAVFFVGLALDVQADKTPYDWAFVRLDYARQDKVEQLRRFCGRIHEIAAAAREDSALINCFKINRDYERMRKQAAPPPEMTARINELRKVMNGHYIANYLTFYDILFVDRDGHIFYTIRNESDLHRNLLDPAAADSPLTRCLKAEPVNELFVDFHDYGPSSESAAFFVEPVMEQGELAGWILLQCAINKINSLFAWNEDLGQTGETILANEQGFMLTESNFEGNSTILKQRLDDRNVQRKFAEGVGHRMVTDYRGQQALTSFEVVEFMGIRWLVVAKLDRDQIVTEHYALHQRYCADRIYDHLSQTPLAPAVNGAAESFGGAGIRVDIDEFLKAGADDCLQTFGVSTCTGMLALYPGKFAYMAHISPQDKIYGGSGANLVGQMIKRIRSFDVYPCDERDLMFVIVAPHFNSLARIIDKLVEEGFLLSQIRVLINPNARSASIVYDYPHNSLLVSWRMDGDAPPGANGLNEAVNLSLIVEKMITPDEIRKEVDNLCRR